jgi:hypothetical protein
MRISPSSSPLLGSPPEGVLSPLWETQAVAVAQLTTALVAVKLISMKTRGFSVNVLRRLK